MKVAFVSLGCAKNLVNTEQMMALVRSAGHEITAQPEGADAAVLNTCGFIDSAKSEAIQNILELAELKKEGKLGKLLVTGCLSQRYQDELMEELPEVDGVMGTGSYTEIVPALEELMAGGTPHRFGDIDHTEGGRGAHPRHPSYTAYLKIAEGCDHRCAFCIIPKLRGRYRSRTMESLLAEAKALADAGVKELIVIAQDITRYGIDLYHKRMLGSCSPSCASCPFTGFACTTCTPTIWTTPSSTSSPVNLRCSTTSTSPPAHQRRHSEAHVPPLHQGGDPRPAGKLRDRLPGLVLRTSLICGLPGEGRRSLRSCASFCGRPVSSGRASSSSHRRRAPPAAEMEDQVDAATAERRVELVVELQSRVMDAFNEERLGECLEVLCEGFDAEMGCYVGRTYADSPTWTARCTSPPAAWCPPGRSSGCASPAPATGISPAR